MKMQVAANKQQQQKTPNKQETNKNGEKYDIIIKGVFMMSYEIYFEMPGGNVVMEEAF